MTRYSDLLDLPAQAVDDVPASSLRTTKLWGLAGRAEGIARQFTAPSASSMAHQIRGASALTTVRASAEHQGVGLGC